MGLVPETTFELSFDEDGNPYDFLLARDRQRARRRLEEEQPFIVVGSPPCAPFSVLNQGLNKLKMQSPENRRKYAEGLVRLHFAIEVFRFQLRGGRRER